MATLPFGLIIYYLLEDIPCKKFSDHKKTVYNFSKNEQESVGNEEVEMKIPFV